MTEDEIFELARRRIKHIERISAAKELFIIILGFAFLGGIYYWLIKYRIFGHHILVPLVFIVAMILTMKSAIYRLITGSSDRSTESIIRDITNKEKK